MKYQELRNRFRGMKLDKAFVNEAIKAMGPGPKEIYPVSIGNVNLTEKTDKVPSIKKLEYEVKGKPTNIEVVFTRWASDIKNPPAPHSDACIDITSLQDAGPINSTK
jgi:hypothetical protein